MSVDFSLLIPEFILAGVGFLVLLADMLVPGSLERRRNVFTGVTAMVGLAAAGIVAGATQVDTNEVMYDGLLFIDRYALVFKLLFMGVGIAVIAMSLDYVARKMSHPGEYYAMIVFAVLGATLMSQAGELLTAFISIELLSFSLYVLVGMARGDKRSAEASTKYILLGAISTAIMLYGISLLFGALGTTVFTEMAPLLGGNVTWDLTMTLGFVMFIAGLGFKLAMVPFHMWSPDVYEGAPTPVTALIAVLSKAATVALILRFLAEAAATATDEWRMPLAILAALTMTIGSLVAVVQTNIKRLLAYSSIAQVGFILVGVSAMTVIGANAVLLHIVGYAFTTLAAFGVVIAVENRTGKEEISDYAGLAHRSPWLAMVMTGALFSLAGLPIFAGFITKFYLFVAAADNGAGAPDMLWLVVIAVANSVVSLYYYIRVVREMYVSESDDKAPMPVAPVMMGVISLMFAGTIWVGVYPGPLSDAINASVTVLTPWVVFAP
jgi:NADH-quinone oxidoreductase subunit N